MKTIGLLGGMSWHSSAVYYRMLNTGVEERLGGLSSARTVMSSVDFAEVTALQRDERWDDVADLLATAARGVEAGGADLLLMCTTSFHRVAEQVEAAIDIPLLHLGDVVAAACQARGVSKVAFTGTSFSMGRAFFRDRIASHGIEVLVPGDDHHSTFDRIIYEELVHGRVNDASRRHVLGVVDQLWEQGAEGVILGCTELEALLDQSDLDLPAFPCTSLHVAAALDRSLA